MSLIHYATWCKSLVSHAELMQSLLRGLAASTNQPSGLLYFMPLGWISQQICLCLLAAA